MTTNTQVATAESGNQFLAAASGHWAGERMLAAMKEGRPLAAAELRTLDTLRKDEWIAFDQALIEEGSIRLRGIADLISAGLTIPVANALGKTIFEYEKVNDMDPAVTSLDGLARGNNDRQTFSLSNLPLPITHKDFNISMRTLAASRERGESLDTTQVRTAGRLVAEQLESLLFAGGSTYGGSPLYGYTTHPDRNTGSFQTNGNWTNGAKVGADYVEDILFMMAVLETDRFYGPYILYVASGVGLELEEDFKSNSDKTIRQRLLEIENLSDIRTADQVPTDEIVLVQMTRDVVALVDGEPLQTVQWDIYGGMAVAFKAFAIQVPLIRSDAQGRSGIYHMT